MAKREKDLVQIIRDNPGCIAVIDNDHWSLHAKDPSENPHEDDDNYEAYEAWEEANTLAQAGDVKRLGDGGYGSGNCYGGDILQALAVIVGIKVESV
ncbi:hypothetical protein HJB67_12975 [Rhizobium lentis]|uniref:hypothetical protein n=1 Tax=Rhizobium lentis TaxID=1138194 RepID=UPI001C82D8F0|nr:hypothetical protein [Rhizobium lentis]MBX5010868.1 hypothetical protein [Rhizobium lentis]